MPDAMTSIQRVQAAIDLRLPDRVPVDLHNFQPAARAMGISMAKVFRDGELLAEAVERPSRQVGHVRRQLAYNAVAASREYFFALMGRGQLSNLVDQARAWSLPAGKATPDPARTSYPH